MRLGEPVQVKLRTLTPVFVGSGEEVGPLCYVVRGQDVLILDQDKFLKSLSGTQMEEYLHWIEESLSPQQRRLRLYLSDFLHSRLRVDPIQFVKERQCIAYSVKCNHNMSFRGFKAHIKTIDYQPYIPGSELKGAIRTSLLYTLMKGDQVGQFLDELRKVKAVHEELIALEEAKTESGRSLEIQRKKVGVQKRKLKNILRKRVSSKIEGMLRGYKNDAKYDIFRMIFISDSQPLTVENLQIELSQAEKASDIRRTSTYIETITIDSETMFTMALVEKADLALRELSLRELKDWLSLDRLLEACYERSKDILEEEGRYFKDQGAILDQISRLKEENEPSSPLLRLGWGQGFLSTTVDLRVKQADPELYEEGIREPISRLRNWRTRKDNFPKTRRVIVDRKDRPVSLLGWVKLIPNPEERNEELMARKLEELKARFGRR
ncbi:MAG: type III-A CRISPR-associated RAMP protein Csm5 [Chloroflexi bacterium]|nr:MAG: type III-A CRISPR-associated RAMP protein Csm5 [Chloroflexota bacterium]